MTLQTNYLTQQKQANKDLKKFNASVKSILDKALISTTALLASLKEKDILSYELVWREQLRNLGYYKLVDSFIDAQFKSAVKHSKLVIPSVKLASKDDLFKIKVLKDMKFKFFANLADSAGLAIKAQLYKYTISDASLTTMTKSIKNTLKGTQLSSYAQTYARTAVGEFQQQVLNIQAPDDSVWIYVGVLDGKTRDYCSGILSQNKAYTRIQKDSIENNPKRAYNCRHRLYPVTKAQAREEGYAY